MTRVRILAICLAASFTVAAWVASTASAALPEWGECGRTAVGHGKYKDEGCIEPATGASKKTEGKYEWYTGKDFLWWQRHEFPRTSETEMELATGPTKLVTSGGHEIACQNGYGQFSILGSFPTNAVYETRLSFSECAEVGGTEASCGNAGSGYTGELSNEESGESPPNGRLVFVAGKGGSEPTVGIELSTVNKNIPETDTREHLFNVECEGPLGTVQIGGEKKGDNALISVVTPVDRMTPVITQSFSESSPGIQSPSALEHGGEKYLQAEFFNEAAWERLALVGTFAGTPEGFQIEIKARA